MSNKKLYLYISVMSFWLLMLSSVTFPYTLHTPSGVWDPIGSTPYPEPARVSNTHPGPFIHWDIQTITFKKNSSGTADIEGTAEFAQINAAFWAWDRIKPSTIDFMDGGTTNATHSSSDGQNVVFWSNDINNPDDIGVTLITYADRFNPRLIDVDIALNDADYTWTTGTGNYNNVFNVKAVVIHEVGHLLGLGHTNVNNNQVLMHAAHQTSTLHDDDIAGLNFLYGSTLKVPQTFQSVREALEFASGNQTVEVKTGSSVKLIGVHPSNVATINVGVTLDVKPGATILFGPSQQLRVYGSLNADGTSSNLIIFKRRTTSSAWHSIFIDGGKLLTFDWCEVDGASNAGLRFDDPAGTVNITNSKFKNCTYDGIRFDSESLNSPPSIDSCEIFDNGDAGIQISNADTVIRNTDIYDNNYGVHVTGNSQPDLGSNNNGGNNIYDNSVWDLYNTSSNNFKAEGNYWGTSTPENVIYHGNDNASYGTVDFTPFSTVLAAPPLLVKVPISPNPVTVAIPTVTAVYQNFPNPFNPETWLPYDLVEEAEVTITIYDTSGNIIRTLSLGTQPAGTYTSRSKAAYWNGRSDTGELVSSGLYFYHLEAGDYHATKKLLILK